MEAAVANFAEPGRKFALLTNGYFADRIGEMAFRQGAEVVRLGKPWANPSIRRKSATSFAPSSRPSWHSCRPRLLPGCSTRPHRFAKPRVKPAR